MSIAIATSSARPARRTQKSVESRRSASRLRFFSSSSVKTGTNAADSAMSANSARSRFGTAKAIVNAEAAPLAP
ncbi:unannotated protein [freshwater metagenome]|uniref:Unannotated protein n=1 Tax=freshwater metagenome TaxID=449393 RepID=A0A6J7KXW6_9ZZZZ